jgi:hypothetical protein
MAPPKPDRRGLPATQIRSASIGTRAAGLNDFSLGLGSTVFNVSAEGRLVAGWLCAVNRAVAGPRWLAALKERRRRGRSAWVAQKGLDDEG